MHTTTGDQGKTFSLDILKVLGLESLSQPEKDKYLDSLLKLVYRYFFQEKIGKNLTEEQKETFADKYTFETNPEKELEELFLEIGDVLPNSAELFTEAVNEMKVKIVRDFYTNKKAQLEEIANTEQDPAVKTRTEEMVAICDTNLGAIEKRAWEAIITV